MNFTHPFPSQMSDYGFQTYLPMDIENRKPTQILGTTVADQTLQHLQQTYGVDAILIGQYSHRPFGRQMDFIQQLIQNTLA